ncbi:MAG: zinc ribbon domain-containing protein [Candidatus Nanoarchaeia archaeon]|nr:zinc ribbon domain-containing protein [Candidatus Haiyanarchaeum thermophilum]
MLKRKRCESCGKVIKDEWSYCPYCGATIGEKIGLKTKWGELGTFGFSFFEEIEKEIEKEFSRLDKEFKQLEMGLPYVSGGGISIRIESTEKGKPKIWVKTTGDFKKYEPEIKARLGVSEGVREISEEEEKMELKMPPVTEEPETKVEKGKDYMRIEITLPDVKDEKNIEIRKLEQSIEIKAIAKDKAYFKLLPIPKDFQILTKEFKNNVLTLVLGR